MQKRNRFSMDLTDEQVEQLKIDAAKRRMTRKDMLLSDHAKVQAEMESDNDKAND